MAHVEEGFVPMSPSLSPVARRLFPSSCNKIMTTSSGTELKSFIGGTTVHNSMSQGRRGRLAGRPGRFPKLGEPFWGLP